MAIWPTQRHKKSALLCNQRNIYNYPLQWPNHSWAQTKFFLMLGWTCMSYFIAKCQSITFKCTYTKHSAVRDDTMNILLYVLSNWNLNSNQISKLYWLRFQGNSSYNKSSVSRNNWCMPMYSSIHYFFVCAFRWNIAFDQGQKVLSLYATLR